MKKVPKNFMAGVSSRLIKLWEKVKNIPEERYLHIDISFLIESNGDEFLKYNLYTPETKHMYFKDKKEFLSYIDNLISTNYRLEVDKCLLKDIKTLEKEIEQKKEIIEQKKKEAKERGLL